MNERLYQPQREIQQKTGNGSVRAAIREAQRVLKQNRKEGLALLDEIFESGVVPAPRPHGYYFGQLFGFNIFPILTPLGEWTAAHWRPWRGKTFDAPSATGDNIFSRPFLPLTRILWPFYHCYSHVRRGTFRAFRFRTSAGPAVSNPFIQVLRIDYNLPENPALTVRRLLDELVQVADGYYLGRANFRGWSGRWDQVAYFTLEENKIIKEKT